MRFFIPRPGEEIVAKQRPVMIITSNNEKELPDAFLRRCVFHFIDFPDKALMRDIVAVHHPKLEESRWSTRPSTRFFQIREMRRLAQAPGAPVSLIDWISGAQGVRASENREAGEEPALPRHSH